MEATPCRKFSADLDITVAELNLCLQELGAKFSSVDYIEVAYGRTDYLDNVCHEFQRGSKYLMVLGDDQCASSSPYQYPSYCGQGLLLICLYS